MRVSDRDIASAGNHDSRGGGQSEVCVCVCTGYLPSCPSLVLEKRQRWLLVNSLPLAVTTTC